MLKFVILWFSLNHNHVFSWLIVSYLDYDWYCILSICLGSWVDDQRSGFGKYFYVNSDSYEGEWQNHVRHGQGSYTYNDTKTKYMGTWKEGRREGHGELIHANHKFVGPFKDDRVRA